MPNLPFFSFIAPTTTSPLSAPLASTDTSEHQGFQTPLNTPLIGEQLGSGQNGEGFWQQLQIASESMELPQGQEFAALVAPIADPNNVEIEIDTELESASGLNSPAHEDVEIQLEGAALPELSVQAIDESTSVVDGQTVIDDRQGLDYINSMRSASPHYQVAQTGENSYQRLGQEKIAAASISPLQTKVDSQIQQTSINQKLEPVQPTLESQLIRPTTLATETTIQASTQPQSMNTMQGNKGFSLSELPQIQEQQSELVDTESLDELTNKSIHEKPLTLTTAKEATASATLQSQNTMTDTANISEVKLAQADASQTLLRDSQENQKSLALDTKGQSQAPSADKTQSQFNKLDVPPNHPQFNEQVAKRVMIMANESMQSARIQLDPPELGSLEIKIKVQNDQVSVQFGSNNHMVRDALEAQSPRLKELMEQQGVNLADVDVREHSNQQGGQQGGGTSSDGEAAEMIANDDAGTSEAQVNIESDSLVDYFA